MRCAEQPVVVVVERCRCAANLRPGSTAARYLASDRMNCHPGISLRNGIRDASRSVADDYVQLGANQVPEYGQSLVALLSLADPCDRLVLGVGPASDRDARHGPRFRVILPVARSPCAGTRLRRREAEIRS